MSESCESCEMYAQDVQDRTQERDELRAILAPLLDGPEVEIGAYGGGTITCVFCDAATVHGHKPGCPVLRKDQLLGRV